MKNRFKVVTIERTIIWKGEEHTDESEMFPPVEGDLYDAINALESQSWDNIDERSDEVICYPADSTMNILNGNIESTQLVIKGAEKDITHLMTYWRAKNANARTG